MTRLAEAGVLFACQCVAFGKKCKLSFLACIDRESSSPDEELTSWQVAQSGNRDAFRSFFSFPEDITGPIYTSARGRFRPVGVLRDIAELRIDGTQAGSLGTLPPSGYIARSGEAPGTSSLEALRPEVLLHQLSLMFCQK